MFYTNEELWEKFLSAKSSHDLTMETADGEASGVFFFFCKVFSEGDRFCMIHCVKGFLFVLFFSFLYLFLFNGAEHFWKTADDSLFFFFGGGNTIVYRLFHVPLSLFGQTPRSQRMPRCSKKHLLWSERCWNRP